MNLRNPLFLLKLEWLKFRKNKLFVVALIMYTIAIPGIYLGWSSLNISENNPLFNKNSFLQFDKIWDLGAYFGNWILFFIAGFLGIVSISSEILYRTARQQIISGLSREEFFFAKILLSVVLSLLFTFYFLLITPIAAYLSTPDPGNLDFLYSSSTGIRFFLMTFSYFVLGQILSILLRKNSLITMFLFFSYAMIIEPLLRWSVHFKLLEGRSFLFYPMNVVEDLTPMPFIEPYKEMIDKVSFSLFLTTKESIIFSIVYLIIFISLGYHLIRKANL
jgi:ABC-type transport system involved in multi-copper enzyme maturation permease subunit